MARNTVKNEVVELVKGKAAAEVSSLPSAVVEPAQPVTLDQGESEPSLVDVLADDAFRACAATGDAQAALAKGKGNAAARVRAILALPDVAMRDAALVQVVRRMDLELSDKKPEGLSASPRNMAKSALRGAMDKAVVMLREGLAAQMLEQAKESKKALTVEAANEKAVAALPRLTVKGGKGGTAYKVEAKAETKADNSTEKAIAALTEWVERFLGDAPNADTAAETLKQAYDVLQAGKDKYAE